VSDIVEDRAGEPIRLDQHADLKSFVGLSLKNGLLNIVTLTLYRFWGKTEVRRRVWATTTLNDEPFEYTGRGVELFLGFVFALLALGLPFLLVVFGAQLLGPAVAALIVLPFYLFLGFLWGFGQFTAFRYMASRTAWRGVRFLLRGSAASYGMKYLGYILLSGVTLGWFWPAARRRLAEPLWQGLRFGDRRFRFDLDEARKEGIYGPYALSWFGAFLAYIGFFASLLAVVMPTLPEGGGQPPEPTLAQIGIVYVLAALFAIVAAAFLAPYEAAMLRSISRGISFEGVRLKLDVSWLGILWLVLGNVLLAGLSLGFLMPVVQARTLKFLVQHLRTAGTVDLSTVRQAAEEGPRTGEGLADAFGISPI
jgi:uncharacterized membrane protein YjgN (DUF898 family)